MIRVKYDASNKFHIAGHALMSFVERSAPAMTTLLRYALFTYVTRSNAV